jgi:hypothetical protein
MNKSDKKYGLKLATILLGASCVTASSSRALTVEGFSVRKFLSDVIGRPNAQGDTPLHRAVQNEDPMAVKSLLTKEVSLFAQNHAGQTPWDLLNKKLEALQQIEQLFRNTVKESSKHSRQLRPPEILPGASSATTFSPQTLTKAEKNAEWLMKNWYNLARDETQSHERVIRNIIENPKEGDQGGLSPTHTNEDGNNLFHIAAANGDKRSLELLATICASMGASTYVSLQKKNHAGQTPLDLAKKGLEKVINECKGPPPKENKMYHQYYKMYTETVDWLEKLQKFYEHFNSGSPHQ